MLITVKLIGNAPARLRLTLLLFGLINWFIPWHSIEIVHFTYNNPFQNQFQTFIPAFFPDIGEPFSPDKLTSIMNHIPPQVSQSRLYEILHTFFASVDVTFIFFVLMGVGLLGLLSDITQYQSYMSMVDRHAINADGLLETFKINNNIPFKDALKVKASPHVSTAMASGIFRPTIWLNDDLLSSPQLHSVLLHELMHLQQLDLAEIMFSRHQQTKLIAQNGRYLNCVIGQESTNVARLKSISLGIQRKPKFLVLAILTLKFGILYPKPLCYNQKTSALCYFSLQVILF